MKNSNIILSLSILMWIGLFNSCQGDNSENPSNTSGPPNNGDHLVLEVDEINTYQTIEHFGASDAWSIQFVGTWPDAKKTAIADLLFSKETDEAGNPEGIGLSLWRFNVGAGSAEQGQASGINDEWRRAETFLEPDGTYNWDRQEGQVWFANAAQSRGVENLLLFSNSPPVYMTRNGKAYADDGVSNLPAENYDDFGLFLATVAEGLGDKGLQVDYISPVNEPQWDWSDGGQEGTPFWNNEIAGIVRALNKQLDNKDLAVTIDIPEAAQINYLFEQGNRPGRGNQIEEFFSENSPNYVGDLSHMGNAISGHSYFTTSPFSTLVSQRERLAAEVEQVTDLKFWMSEYCILGDNNGEINGNGRDLGIDPALYMARVIHTDLAVAQATAWHWWLGVSPYDYKDGLVYIDHQKEDGNFYESKMLWALGNYSRFIRPGFHRIAIGNPKRNQLNESFLFSAFKDPDSEEVIVVIVNSGIGEENIEIKFGTEENRIIETYTTSSQMDLEYKEIRDGELISIPARSIVTVTFQKS